MSVPITQIETVLLAVGKVLTAPNLAAAKEAVTTHFADVDADFRVVEAVLGFAGVFFAPAAQANQIVQIAQALYDINQQLPPYKQPEGTILFMGVTVADKGLFQ